MMGHADYYKRGDYNAICDRCGRKFKASQLRKTWDGLMVCSRDWEPRHPQDYVKSPNPETVPPWTRPQPTPIYASTGYSAIAGIAIAGHAVTGLDF